MIKYILVFLFHDVVAILMNSNEMKTNDLLALLKLAMEYATSCSFSLNTDRQARLTLSNKVL